MEFIKNNWWYFLLVGIFGYMMLRKGGTGCCGGHSHSNNKDSDQDHHAHEDKVNDGSTMPKIAKDPVCGMDVDTNSALSATKYGKTYYFCSKSCKREFTES